MGKMSDIEIGLQEEARDELLCEIDYWRSRTEAAGVLLGDVRDACLFAEDDGLTGITTDPHIDERLFGKIVTFLNGTKK